MTWSEEVYTGVFLQYQRVEDGLIISVVQGDGGVLWWRKEPFLTDFHRDQKGKLRFRQTITTALKVAGAAFQHSVMSHSEQRLYGLLVNAGIGGY